MNTGRKVERECEYFQIISFYSVPYDLKCYCLRQVRERADNVVYCILLHQPRRGNEFYGTRSRIRHRRIRLPTSKSEFLYIYSIRDNCDWSRRAHIARPVRKVLRNCLNSVSALKNFSKALAEYCKEELVNAWDADANADDFGAADALPLRHCAREPRRYDKHPHIVPTLGNLFERQLRSANIGQIGSGIN